MNIFGENVFFWGGLVVQSSQLYNRSKALNCHREVKRNKNSSCLHDVFMSPNAFCCAFQKSVVFFLLTPEGAEPKLNIFLLLGWFDLYDICNYEAIKGAQEIKELSILINLLKCFMEEISTATRNS